MKKPEQYIVIDDDHTNNFICNHVIKKFDPNAAVILFEDSGLALQSFLNGAEKISSRKKTVVFLDLNMPLMSGWDFLDELKKMNPEILQFFKFYILSSSIEDVSHQKEKYPFLAGFLSKPLTKAHLQNIEEGEEKQNSQEVIFKV